MNCYLDFVHTARRAPEILVLARKRNELIVFFRLYGLFVVLHTVKGQ